MKYRIDHDYHIHSRLSPCSGDDKQTPEQILSYAVKCGFTSVCLTDHFWDSAVEAKLGKPDFYNQLDYEFVSKSLPLPESEDVKFYFGCECELLRDMTLGISPKVMKKMDFIVIPPNHFHMVPHVYPDGDNSVENRAKAVLDRLRGILDMELPFNKVGIAHLTDSLAAPFTDTAHIELVSMWRRDELTDIFGRLAERGVGIELNIDWYSYKPDQIDEIMRPYRIASECGCKFYLGSDTHVSGEYSHTPKRFIAVVNYLSLEEEQKFHIPDKGTN